MNKDKMNTSSQKMKKDVSNVVLDIQSSIHLPPGLQNHAKEADRLRRKNENYEIMTDIFKNASVQKLIGQIEKEGILHIKTIGYLYYLYYNIYVSTKCHDKTLILFNHIIRDNFLRSQFMKMIEQMYSTTSVIPPQMNHLTDKQNIQTDEYNFYVFCQQKQGFIKREIEQVIHSIKNILSWSNDPELKYEKIEFDTNNHMTEIVQTKKYTFQVKYTDKKKSVVCVFENNTPNVSYVFYIERDNNQGELDIEDIIQKTIDVCQMDWIMKTKLKRIKIHTENIDKFHIYEFE